MSKELIPNVKKMGHYTITRYENTNRGMVEYEQRDPKASTVQTIIEEWISENYKQDTIDNGDVRGLVHRMVLDNLLWISSDMLKEIDKVTNTVLTKKDLQTYPIDFVVKQVAQYFRMIYKRKDL